MRLAKPRSRRSNADWHIEMVRPGTALVVVPLPSEALDHEVAQLAERGFTVRSMDVLTWW
jgi:hypothetical protein